MLEESVSHYRIIKKLGAGGMGEVYLAEDTKLDRQVALKILPQEFAKSDERMRRFVQEAKSASALTHPNIIAIYEIGETDKNHFIVTEYIEGETLHHHIHNSRMKAREVLDVTVQVASALAAAHQAGIIHRDIKPENIMLRPDGIVKVLDFGLAKLTEKRAPTTDSEAATISKKVTDPGTIMGTVAYMSPEQARGKQVDARTDIFSLGIVLYEMIAGRMPFAGESSTDVLAAILDKEPPPLTRFADEVPTELQRIVSKCLRKERDERYQTMKGLLADLKELREELALEAKLERSIRPAGGSTGDNLQTLTAEGVITRGQNLQAPSAARAQTTSSAEYLISEIKQHKRGIAVALLIVLLAASGLGYWFFFLYQANVRQIESIAVMPFVNESGNADVEYLSDGMTETLIRSLSQLPNLNVKARSSVFRYKGRETNPQTVGEELNVQAILNGRVAQRGDQLILSLELIDAQTENVIWSEQYNRRQADLVMLQSEIARHVSSKLRTKLSGADEQKLAKSYTANPEAYQHYLRGRFYWNKRNAENIRKAIEQFRMAAEKDPGYALAYSGLADCYVVAPNYAGTASSETLPSARAYATRAIELDGSLAEAYASLGMVNYFSWNFAEAETAFKRSIELNPTYPTAHHWYSRYLRAVGRSDEAFAEIRRAKDLDPLSLVIMNNIAENYIDRGDMNSALDECKRMVELDPSFFGTYQTLCIIYSKQGRFPEALASAQKGVELSNRSNATLALAGYVQGQSGRRDAAQAIIVELEKRYAIKEADGRDLAIVYTGLDQKDKAFEWLEKSYQDRSLFMAVLRLEPLLESLRSDPRLQDLFRRIGLPQ
ncbi:MAG TPA: protein kinase [Blastocatellia bacterium]|jgi:serine/threonine-protein kinase